MPYKNDEQHFIKEKIKDKPVNKKQLLQKGMATIGYAILFGFVSCLVFCALRPEIEKWFTPKEDQWVGIPKDTLSDEENAADTCADSEQEAADTNQKPKKEDKKQTVYITEKKDMTLDDYQVLQNELYQIGNKVNKGFLLLLCQCVAFGFLPIMGFFNLCHYSIRGVTPDISIPYRKRKYWMQNCIDDFHAVRLKALFPDKTVIKCLYIRIFDTGYFLSPDLT